MHYYRYSNAEVSCWYKYLLFSYNIVFWLAGVVFLGVGLWAWSEKGVLSDLTKVTRMHGIDPVVLVLMVGVVMFTLGFAGCVGALRENICLLNFFCSTIVLIFFLELAVAVLAFLFQDWVRDRFREFFESNIRSYRDDIDLQNLIDSLQKAVSTTPTFSLIELGHPGFSLCARLGAQAGGEHGTLRPQLCPQQGGRGGATPASGQVSFVRSCVLTGQACSQGAVPQVLQVGSLASLVTTPTPSGLDLSSPDHADSHGPLGPVGTEGQSSAHDSLSEPIPVPFLPGTFSPSCLRGQSAWSKFLQTKRNVTSLEYVPGG
ncbi:tetraspanin-14 isoform X2 [Moschus berezovskii]|uniref:tetraspanin-14 isoform X2 n=1 Tax=Moschus berezovskii TaxID=68408 RepID=UPI0024442E42|nr:tetraspanin-14 isoform X2 [Moschus berezovskii]